MNKLARYLILLACFPVVARASDWMVGINQGSLGPGIEVARVIEKNSFNVRLGLNSSSSNNAFPAIPVSDSSGVSSAPFSLNSLFSNRAQYGAASQSLQAVKVLADWYPFEGAFRTTAGVMYMSYKGAIQNSVGSDGTPLGQDNLSSPFEDFRNALTNLFLFAFANQPQHPQRGISTDNSGGLYTHDVQINSLQPYIGAGWDFRFTEGTNWGYSIDFGGYGIGSPQVVSKFNCITSTIGTCSTLQSNTASENSKLASSIGNIDWEFVFGVNYHF